MPSLVFFINCTWQSQLPKLSCFLCIYNSCIFPILGKCLTASNINAYQITNRLIIDWALPATPTPYELRYREAFTESTRWTLVSTSRWQSLENLSCLAISSAVHSTYSRTSAGCYCRAYATWTARRHSMQTICRQISQRSLSFVLTDPKLFGKEWLIVLYRKKKKQKQNSMSAGSLAPRWDTTTISDTKAEEDIRNAI